MSHVGLLRQYAEERDPPRRRVSSPWKFSPPAKASEYHLIDLAAGVSHGGLRRWPGLGNAPARKACRPGTSSMAMFESSTTIRGETSVISSAAHRAAVGQAK